MSVAPQRHLLKYEFDRHGWNTVDASRKTGVSRYVISRALNGHRIAPRSLQKIAEALAAAPVVDGGLLQLPSAAPSGRRKRHQLEQVEV